MSGLVSALSIWIVLCFVAAVVFHRYPVHLVCASFALWAIIPYAAVPAVTGVKIGPHPGALLGLATFIIQIAVQPAALGRAFVRRFPFFLVVLIVFAAGVFTTLMGPKLGGGVKLADQMLVPLLTFWIVSASALARPELVRLVRNTIIVVALVEAAYSLVQYAANNVIFWQSAYETRYWFKNGYHRWMGATDHPLVLALLLSAAIPLLCFLRGWPQLLSMLVMATAMVVTQSRTGIVAAAIGAIFVILTSRASVGRKTITITALAVGGIAVASSSLATGLQDRIANDAGSAAARTTALDYFSRHWTDYFLSGTGVDSSFRLANTAGLRSSFENAFVMYAIDIGVVFAAAYLIVLAVTAVMSSRRDRTGAWFSVLVVVVICNTFSSLEVDTIIGPLLFLLLAVAVNSTPDMDHPREVEPAVEAEPDRELAAA